MISLRPATLDTVRPLRLRALREDSDAFGSTLAGEQAQLDRDWASFWVTDSLIAFDGDTPVGMASLKIDDGQARLLGMWVAPEARGRGVAQALARTLIEHAGDRPITLCVAEGAHAARRLYERLGFTPTGTTGTLRPDSSIRTFDLRRDPGARG